MKIPGSWQDVATSYQSMEHWQQSFILVLLSAAVFIALEYGMLYSPVASYLRALLKANPKLKPKDIEASVPLLITRIVGFIHNAFQVPLAIWALSQPYLAADRLHATSPWTHLMLCVAAGFFLHDAIACFLRESPFYIIHGASCCIGYTAGACLGTLHFFGALFLLWEISTPFVQMRWALYKLGKAETTLYKVNAILMILSFFLARIVAGTYFCLLLIWDSYREIVNPPLTGAVPTAFLLAFVTIALTICSLNYFWFSKMVTVLIHIYHKGSSWTSASDASTIKDD